MTVRRPDVDLSPPVEAGGERTRRGALRGALVLAAGGAGATLLGACAAGPDTAAQTERATDRDALSRLLAVQLELAAGYRAWVGVLGGEDRALAETIIRRRDDERRVVRRLGAREPVARPAAEGAQTPPAAWRLAERLEQRGLAVAIETVAELGDPDARNAIMGIVVAGGEQLAAVRDRRGTRLLPDPFVMGRL